MEKNPARSGTARPGCLRLRHLRLRWLVMQNGWAGILGRLPGRAEPGSGLAREAPVSASAVKTRIRRAPGGAMAPRWTLSRGW